MIRVDLLAAGSFMHADEMIDVHQNSGLICLETILRGRSRKEFQSVSKFQDMLRIF